MMLNEVALFARRSFPHIEETEGLFFRWNDVGEVYAACFLGFCILALDGKPHDGQAGERIYLLGIDEFDWIALADANDHEGFDATLEIASGIQVSEAAEIIIRERMQNEVK